MPQGNVRLAQYGSRIEAELARSRLDAGGVPSHIEADDVGGTYPVLGKGGVSLWVPAAHVEEANQILSAPSPDPGDSPGDLRAAENEVRGRVPANGFASRAGTAAFLVLVGVAAGFLLGRNQNPADWTYDPTETGVSESDRNDDGVADAWYEYQGDEWTRSRSDRNFDGEPDEWHEFEDGDPSASEYDNDFDGTPDQWIEYSHGNPSTSKIDLDADGTVDASVVYEHGLPSRYELAPNGGRVEQVERYVNGRLREVYSVSDSGERKLIRRYDILGREIGVAD